MVGQVVGAVAPVVVQSATEDGSILNRLLKLVTIGAIIASIIVVVIVLFLAFNIWEQVGGTITQVGSFLSFANPFRGIGIALTGLFSAFATRR